MAITTSVKDSGGTWRTALNVWVRDSGAWRQSVKVFAHDGTTWRQVYTRLTLNTTTVSVHDVSAVPGTQTAQINFTTTGSLVGTNLTGSANWATPNGTGIGSGYHVRAVHLSGNENTATLPDFVYGTWYSLAAGKPFSWQTASYRIGTLRFDLSADGGATTAASFNCNVEVGYDPP